MFAYDDFGAGQARLNELAEVPLHVVKFDMSLIRDIDCASTKKQQKITVPRSTSSWEWAQSHSQRAWKQKEKPSSADWPVFQLCQGCLTGMP